MMRFLSKSTLWLLIAGYISLLGCVWITPSWADETFVREMILGLIRPSAPSQIKEQEHRSIIDQLLAVPFARLKNGAYQAATSAHAFRSPELRNSPLNTKTSFYNNTDFTKAGQPGILWRSLGISQSNVERIQPVLANAAPNDQNQLNSHGYFASAGSLAGDVTSLYTSFRIDISRTHFTLKLFGMRNGRKHELYSTKVGIGSPEFPTPHGKYYITRIYDDHPWWIPPNRPWAWGQIPSRTVYGGHMMPLMSKRPMRKSNKDELDLDKIAPKMRIFDSGAYRVHGTDSPWSVGTNQSHGCIRLKNSTVKALSDTIKLYVGTTERGESRNGTYVKLTRPVIVQLH
jgi:L,D-transpeptidase ErfK/SrfK